MRNERRIEILICSEQWNAIVVAAVMVPLTLPIDHAAVTAPGPMPKPDDTHEQGYPTGSVMARSAASVGTGITQAASAAW